MTDINYKEIYKGPNTVFYDDNPVYKKDSSVKNNYYSDPEEEGVNERKIKKAAFRLRCKRFTNSFIISRNKKIIWQEFFNRNNWKKSHNIHSLSKSILSVVLGVAIDKGLFSLESNVCDILPEMFNGPHRVEATDLKVKHLIEMTSGYDWEEDSTEYRIEKSSHWVKEILNRPFNDIPGEVFNYNTGGTHVLSAIIQKTSGMDLCSFAHKYLFNPLEVTVEQWSRDPQDYFCGGYNLYMTPNDLINFSHLILEKGVFNGERVVSEKWIRESTQSITFVNGLHYGRGWWVDVIAGYKTTIAWGYGGQFLFIVPDLSLSVVITGNTTKYGSDYDARRLMRRYIIPAVMS